MKTKSKRMLSTLMALALLFGLFAAMPLTAVAQPTLNIIPPPVIKSHPVDRTVSVGGTATFSVTATGTDLTYQWEYLNGTTWYPLSGNITATMTLANVPNEYNNTRFRCAVTGKSGLVAFPTATTVYSNEARLTVMQAAPTFYMDIGGVDNVDIASNQSGTGWTWTASSKTLTLTSAYTREFIQIRCAQTDTINLVYSGNVTIKNPHIDLCALLCDGRLNMTGSGGTLTIDSTDGWGIGVERVTINNGVYNISSGSDGISSNGGIAINGGSVAISTSSSSGIYGYHSDVSINGGTVTIAAGGSAGIEADNITISGGTVAINTLANGIIASYNVAISGGTVAINAGDDGIYTEWGNITLSGGSGSIRTSGGMDPTWTGLAVRVPSNNSLTIGSGMQVNGWDGSAYTVPSVITIVPVSTSSNKTFASQAAPTTGLQNIQFGPAAAPTISGPTTMTLAAGYPATSTGAYTLTGTPAPTVTKTSGNASIVWNDSTKKLDIAAGLAAGTYPVVLTATSGTSNATLTFTLTVTAAGSGKMSNFTKTKTYSVGLFSDVNENAWYGFTQQKAIANAYEYGLMQGSGNKFSPTGNMRLNEALAIAARVHHIYNGGDGVFIQGNPWYQVYVDYAISNGIINAGSFPDYNKAATRAEMANIFSRALPETEFTTQNTVNSLPDVNNSTPYREAIFMLYRAGIVEGDSTGAFKPGNNITRAEASAIISRVILPATRISGKTF